MSYVRDAAIFQGPSELHALVRAHDWAATPLGSVAGWPQSLRTLVKMLLASRYPMVLAWGPGLLQFYNDAYARLIGTKHPTALGQELRVTLAEGWDTLGPMIAEVMASGVANWTPALLLILERSGYREEAYFSVSHAPAEDDDGRIVGMLAVCSEVTQQVLSERRLRLLHDLAFKSDVSQTVERTCQQLEACLGEMGEFVLEPGEVDLGALLGRLRDEIALSLERHTLELTLPAAPILIWGDELRLEQALQNLIGNAVKYSPLGGTVQIWATQHEGSASIHVQDEGIGIPEADRQRIFERFYRATMGNHSYISGLGIGLYLVKEIVTAHGGTIAVASQEGRGSTFTLSLPLGGAHGRQVEQRG